MTAIRELHAALEGKSAADASAARALQAARKATDTRPTEGQRAAGNYAKGKVRLHGLEISLENPKGSTRSGKDANGKAWSTRMHHDYGYIKRTEGKDGDHVDVFIGPDPDVELVYVVNQYVGGKFDEHKCLLGFKSEAAAREGYLANYQKGWDGLRSIFPTTVPQFKWWLRHGDTRREIHDGAFAAYRSGDRGLRKAGDVGGADNLVQTDNGSTMTFGEVAEQCARRVRNAIAMDEANGTLPEVPVAGMVAHVHHEPACPYCGEEMPEKHYIPDWDNRGVSAAGPLGDSGPEVAARLKQSCSLAELHDCISGNGK